MADDRHEAYRLLFGVSELSRFFTDYKDKYPAGLLAYLLIQAAKENPNATTMFFIDEVKKRLHE